MREGWELRKIADIVEPVSTIDPRKMPGADFTYIDVSAVSRQSHEVVETSLIRGKDAPSRARRLVRAGDVIFATIRPTLQRIAEIPPALDGAVCSTGYFVLRPKARVLTRFLFYSLFSERFSKKIAGLQRGAAYPAVSDADVKAREILVPPLPEQKRIVAILDEAFAGIATAVANTEKNLANARELFESHLRAVLKQELDRSPEVPIEKYIEFIDYRGKTPQKTASGLRLITAKNVRMGFLQREPEEFVDPEIYDDWMTRGIPRKGDVLFTTEAPLGLVCQLDTDEKVVFAQRIITMQPDRDVIDPVYLKFALRSAPMQARIQEKATGATTTGIKASLLKTIKLPLPAMSDQMVIAERAGSLEEESKHLETIYEEKLAALYELKQSLLQNAFSGELTAGKAASDAVRQVEEIA